MYKTVRINADNTIGLVEFEKWWFSEWERELNAEYTESVKTEIMRALLGDLTVMIVDESGAIKRLPINRCASELYGMRFHGVPIRGDVLFGVLKRADIVPPDDPEHVMEVLLKAFTYLRRGESK